MARREKAIVKHLIVFNVAAGISQEATIAMAHKAREVLTQIPGVVGVSFGIAVSPQPAYRYLLIIDFSDESVIDLYRDHPVHVKFANECFRPTAVHRITTDFRMVLGADALGETFCPRCAPLGEVANGPLD